MPFENVGKLKIHLAGNGSIDGTEGREAMLTLIGAIDALRGQLEAQKLLVEDLALRLKAAGK